MGYVAPLTRTEKAVQIPVQLAQESGCNEQQPENGNSAISKENETLQLPATSQCGEDRMRTTNEIAERTRHLRSCGAESGALVKTSGNADQAKRLITDPDLEFIMKAWPLLEPQAKSQMMEIARAAGWER